MSLSPSDPLVVEDFKRVEGSDEVVSPGGKTDGLGGLGLFLVTYCQR